MLTSKYILPGCRRTLLIRYTSLRAIVRGMLSTSPPSVTATFITAAQRRLLQTNAALPPPADALFTRKPETGKVVPTAELRAVLTRARTLYGSGLGFASLRVLAQPVRATTVFVWEDGSDMEAVLAEIDADISQALQSSREEIDGGRVVDIASARAAISDLKSAVRESKLAVENWGGVYPFERAEATLEFWKL
ncbi:hypothetical protein NM688_g3473 [Phlebia brevispora]|uniref:Uncharacterized protein n=1 Tax=Phlebia brevispora TaxID=194682 RepID=A0ACC1T5U2_9APHY|nr:hypothetical protein NM688_g3473 [Phlebia brevispora]